MIIDSLNKNKKFVIYGAQVVAYGAMVAIEGLTGRRPECFAVGKPAGKTWFPKGNPDEIDGIPVVPIENVEREMFIVVGVTELIQQEVVPFLNRNGYNNYYLLTQKEEYLLMSEYYKQIGRFPLAEPEKLSGTQLSGFNKDIDFVLYEVRNDKDKPLVHPPRLLFFERDIQAGAALTDSRVANLTDDTLDSISKKNRMYCEMTAVYWIWKNTAHDWVGIEHYRRHLLVAPEMVLGEADAIMPLPYICYPNEQTQFLRFTTEGVLQAMLSAIQDLHSDCYEAYRQILFGKYQYTYNLVCARKSVFDDYCRWLFEITDRMEKMSDQVPELTETRAFSYVAEVLTNLYFMLNEKKLRIRHVGKTIHV